MGGRALDSCVVDTWPCLFLVSAASHLLSKTCSVVKWAVIDVNVSYLLDVTSMSRSHVTIRICTIQNPPCWMRLLPEYRAYKTLPAPWAMSLQNPYCSTSLLPEYKLTKPSLLKKPATWESSIQNPPCSTSMLPEHQSYKKTLLNKPAPRASRIQNLPCLTSLLSEHPAYNTLIAKLACSLNIELTRLQKQSN